jgi:cytochrome c oxidase cbb3-type subunit I/II
MALRIVGGTLYLAGFLLLGYNVLRTIRGAEVVDGSAEVLVEDAPSPRVGVVGTFANPPVVFSVLGTLFACVWMFGGDLLRLVGLFGTITSVIIAWLHFETKKRGWSDWYDRLLLNAAPFTVLTFIAVAAGGLIQIIPTVLVNRARNVEDRIQVPYTPLELAGRDLYISEGCYNCHSQMIRTLVPDVMRYGDYSRLGESIYDHPYQWGSRRIGPDLAREGGKYPDSWHFQHMMNPRAISPGSNMPNYPWLFDTDTDVAALPAKISVQRTLGVPYPEWTPAEIHARVDEQAAGIVARLRDADLRVEPDRQIVALIAYLQKLGKSVPAGGTLKVAGSE